MVASLKGSLVLVAVMDEAIETLAGLEGWQPEDYAARLHYRGETDAFSVEYYAPNDRVLYWRIREAGEAAVPVARAAVPDPLRRRVRGDLETASVDPDVERESI